MPRISRIDSKTYHLPLKGALTWGRGHELRQLAHVLIRVELSDGAVGIAEATPRPSIYGETQVSIVHIVEEHLAPLLQGRNVDSFDAVAALAARLEQIRNNNAAKGALDMALHQALANSQGVGLRDYLGVPRDKILLSYIVSTGAPDAVYADVESAYQAGVRVFKVKIGRDIAEESNIITHLIDSYPAARFYADANQTLDRGNAAAILDDLFELGVMHCEEALPVHQLAARRQLRRDCAMPIIADDSAFTPFELERELAFDTFDILNIKTARTGFSRSREMLQTCASAGKDVMVGSQASSLLGCLHAAIFAGYREINCASECSFYLQTEADQQQAPAIEDGYMRLDMAEASLNQLQAQLDNFA